MSALVTFIAGLPRRILIIKPSSLGDVTHTLPFLKLLRRRWPKAHISWLVSPACAGLLEGRSDLDDLILFDRKRLGKAWWNPAAAIDLFRFRREMRRRQFDLVIDLQGLLRSGWMAWETGAPVRIGFSNARELSWLFYTVCVPIDTMEQHAIDRYLRMAAALGCETEPVRFDLAASAADHAYIDRLVDARRFAVLLPAATWPTKRWPIENYAQLVRPLRQQFGLETVVAGGPDAIDLAASVHGAINVAGKTTLGQLVALLEKAELVIANDSGPMHMAAALGRPLVAIFGPTNAIRTGPYRRPESVVRTGTDCSPCYRKRCRSCKCVRDISVEAVLAAAQRQLDEPARGHLSAPIPRSIAAHE